MRAALSAFPLILLASSLPAEAQDAGAPEDGPLWVDAGAAEAACGGAVTAPGIEPAVQRARLACVVRAEAEELSTRLPYRTPGENTVLQRTYVNELTTTYERIADFRRSDMPAGAMDRFISTVRTTICGTERQRQRIALGAPYRYRWLDRDQVLLGELLVSAC